MSNFFFNKETATVAASKANDIISNKETSMLEKAIAISALVENIYDTAHTMLGGVGINLFMAHALGDDFPIETRIQFANFSPTSAEVLQYFRETNEAADAFYTNLDQYLIRIIGDVQSTSEETALEAIGALMPAIVESGLFKSAIDFADNAANEAAIAVMEYNKI